MMRQWVGRRLGELWITTWGLAGMVMVGFMIWRWG